MGCGEVVLDGLEETGEVEDAEDAEDAEGTDESEEVVMNGLSVFPPVAA